MTFFLRIGVCRRLTVAPFLPEGLQPDTFQGSAWLGVVPLWMDRFNFRGVPSIPGTSSFPELHFRTYVHDHMGTPGIYNLTVDIGSLLATTAARIVFRIPCNWAEMRLNQRTEREYSFYSRRMFVNSPVIFSARYRGLGPTRRLAEIRSRITGVLLHGTLLHVQAEPCGTGGTSEYPYGDFAAGRCGGGDRPQ